MDAPIIPKKLFWRDYHLIADAIKLMAETARTEGLSSDHIATWIQNDYMKELLLMKWVEQISVDGQLSEETSITHFSTIRKISVNDFIAMGMLMLVDGYGPDEIHWFLTALGEMHQRVTKQGVSGKSWRQVVQ